MRALHLPLLIALLMLVVGVAAGCEEMRGSIDGRMTDQNGKPTAGAPVRAERGGQPGILIRTDEDGNYSFNNVHAGEWELAFYDEDGWLVGRESVTVRAEETTRLDFTIGEKPLPPGVREKLYFKSEEPLAK